MIPQRPDGPLNLIFDADDTLWDSNVHFLEAETTFISTLGRAGIRELSLATIMGAASSSCSYAAAATAKSLFKRGANFTTSKIQRSRRP